jgi:hypothetical protein
MAGALYKMAEFNGVLIPLWLFARKKQVRLRQSFG